MSETSPRQSNFIRQIIDQDLALGKNDGRVATRFPPEPNGYLHIGHAKSICLNFGIAEDYHGTCNLRFDDTNPVKEDVEYVESIKADVKWLGFDWGDRLYHASDYFDRLYDFAVELIEAGKAYVDDHSAEEVRRFRGTLTEPGTESPHRNRSFEENLALFKRMREGEFPDGTRVLRAKIDMASPNLNMRDPTIFRIRHASHPITGDKWCIYPMYDFTHCLSDALEGITHSLCTLEFEDHRPLYDWFLDNLNVPCHPQQIEFARLNLTYNVMSKRKLNLLVQQGHVSGWDDPRMPTLIGVRRRGFTPSAIRTFCQRIGLTKKDTTIDMGQLEGCIRDDLDPVCLRAMAVLKPLKLVIENYPADAVEELDAANHPQRPDAGTRKLPFCREIYIERDDFMEDPPKQFFRLAPGREVRLRFAYIIKCDEVVKDRAGDVVELRCSYDPATRSGSGTSTRKVKGTIHWVSARHAVRAEIRLYDRLFSKPNPEAGGNFLDALNPDSREILLDSVVEPGLAEAPPEARYQFERLGYFCADRHDHRPGKPVFNRTVTLRDSWAKIEQTGKG